VGEELAIEAQNHRRTALLCSGYNALQRFEIPTFEITHCIASGASSSEHFEDGLERHGYKPG
jgi:hypothetical protein